MLILKMNGAGIWTYIKEKWEEIIQKLKVEYFLSNISFETWIPLEVYEIRGNTLYLTVNFKASIEHIQNKYLLPLKVCIAKYRDRVSD